MKLLYSHTALTTDNEWTTCHGFVSLCLGLCIFPPLKKEERIFQPEFSPGLHR